MLGKRPMITTRFEASESPLKALSDADMGDVITDGKKMAVMFHDQAFVEAKRREALAATEEAGAAAAERQQMIDAIAAYGDIGSDRQVVAEMLNLDLDNLPQYQIDKVGSRQYQILDEAGESIDGRNYSTLKGAKKGAEIAQKEQTKQYIASGQGCCCSFI